VKSALQPNQTLQETAPCVTVAASAAAFPPAMHGPRQPPPSLSLGSLGQLAPPVDRSRLGRYFAPMSTDQLLAEAMALPLPERLTLAQTLWQSIDAGLSDTEEREAVEEAIRRDEELSSGAVVGRTHEEVMQAARRAIGCA